jgi:hypothetical protein
VDLDMGVSSRGVSWQPFAMKRVRQGR